MRGAAFIGLIGLLGTGAAQAAEPKLDGVWVAASPRMELAPADGKPVPFTTEGRKRYKENKTLAAKRDYSYDYTVSRCSSPGMPRAMLTNEPFRIAQRPEVVAIMFKWNNLLRQIDLRPAEVRDSFEKATAPDKPDFVVPTMKGETLGHWEGSTLVAHTTALSPNKLLDSFQANSDQLELTERFTLTDANTLEDRITISDPEMFVKPWEAVITYKRLSDDTYPFAEDICLDRKQGGQITWPH